VTDCATAYTREFILSALPAHSKRVLEIGCGDGALAEALGQYGLDVVAIDVDAALVAAAQKRGVDARQAEWPAFSDGDFDAVLFTRSLHHVHDLEASVAAAFEALRANGRVIVEDFMAEGCTERSERWFASLAALLDCGGWLVDPTGYLAQALGEAEPEGHDHSLHSSAMIAATLGSRAAIVRTEPSAYYFRYVLPALGGGSGLADAFLDHEQAMIAAGAIDALGRRHVAEGRIGFGARDG
jgi:SAM-dependent methyltransferase